MIDEVIDRAALARIERMAGKDAAAQIVTLFLESAPERIASLRDGQTAGHSEEVARQLHSLRSSAEMLGATALASLTARMETLAQAGDLSGVEGCLDDLDREFDRFKRLLDGGSS